MCSVGGGSNDAYKEQRRLLNEQRRREARLAAEADFALRDFNDDWFARREAMLRALGLQAVEDQAADAAESLLKAMASRGLAGSSIEARAYGDLAGQVARARAQVAQDAARATLGERMQLEELRRALASGARQAVEPSTVAAMLAAAGGGVQVPQISAPIGGIAGLLGALAPVLQAEARGFRGTGLGLFPQSKAWYEVR
jgi:hypothetical protein